MEQDKINAYMSLYTALVTLAKLAAPLIPFMTEEIYQNLVRSVDTKAPESIHLCDYPVADNSLIDKSLEDSMDEVLNVVVLGRAARNAANIKNRQPIGNMYIKAEETLGELYTQIIKEELNVKNVEFREDVENFVSYSFKPQLKTVGPKYGKLLGKIREVLTNLDGAKAMAELKSNGSLDFDFDGEKVSLTNEDLLIDTVKSDNYISEGNNKVTIVLDINLTKELLDEGFLRELISKVQTMRKEAGFEVVDHIELFLKDNAKLIDIVKVNEAELMSEVLCDKITYGNIKGYEKEWNLNGENVVVGVKKI